MILYVLGCLLIGFLFLLTAMLLLVLIAEYLDKKLGGKK